MMKSWWFRTVANCCLGVFTTILLSVVTILMTPAGATLASTMTSATSVSAAPLAPIPAPMAAAGPCGDKSKRYFDCGNGTVTDSMTGLIWLKDPNCLPSQPWEDAKKAIAALKNGACMLTDGSAPGDWRLPTNAEWEMTMSKAKSSSCSYPTLTDDAGTGCFKGGQSSFAGLESDYYWSSVVVEGMGRVYVGDLDHGNILNVGPTNPQRVWPVRGAQR